MVAFWITAAKLVISLRMQNFILRFFVRFFIFFESQNFCAYISPVNTEANHKMTIKNQPIKI
jgi:hypothetical protein